MSSSAVLMRAMRPKHARLAASLAYCARVTRGVGILERSWPKLIFLFALSKSPRRRLLGQLRGEVSLT